MRLDIQLGCVSRAPVDVDKHVEPGGQSLPATCLPQPRIHFIHSFVIVIVVVVVVVCTAVLCHSHTIGLAVRARRKISSRVHLAGRFAMPFLHSVC